MGKSEGQPWLASFTTTTLALILGLLLVLVISSPHNVLARPARHAPDEEGPCPSHCRCSSSPPTPDNRTATTSVRCANAGLTSLPSRLPASLASLDLRGNEIGDLDAGRLSHLGHLQRVDLSHNALSVLRAGSLDGLFQVTSLDLSSNAIDAVPGKVFGSLAAVETVSLAFNRLTRLDDDMFFGLQTAVVLNLSGNAISQVSSSSPPFLHLQCLEVLDLSQNRLQHLPAHAFQGLESVHTILLNGNALASVSGTFRGLAKLNFLDLSHNALTTLGENALADLPSLNNLHLSFNNITEISPAFCGNASSSSVKSMDLRGNSIRRLESRTFRLFPALETLDVSQMPYLQSVGFEAFSGAVSLTALNLSLSPALSFLHPQALVSLPQLSQLDLRSDNLSALSHLTFLSNPRLHRVFLSHNPWRCGCGLTWMLRGAGTATPTPTPTPINTDTATSNHSTFIADLDEVECILQATGDNSSSATVPITHSQEIIQCKNTTVMTNATDKVVYAAIGSRVVMLCDYHSGEEEPDASSSSAVIWTTPRGRTFHYHPFHLDAVSHLVGVDDALNLTGEFHRRHPWHWESSYDADLQDDPDHLVLLSDGSLYVDFMLFNDGGPYRCEVHNGAGHKVFTMTTTLRLDRRVMMQVKVTSILVGLACAASFFTLNTVYVIIMWVARRLINKRRRERIHRLLVTLDDYTTTQVARIRTNYHHQLGRIRDHYHLQSLRLKDNYNSQVKRMRQGCSNQAERIRENYNTSLTHLKDYSSHQIQQIRDATNNQITRIRDYGSLQMERLRETYKLQQQHMLKVMEAMNMENCRNVVESECMRTESMIFDINFPDWEEVENVSSLSSNEEETDAYSQTESVYITALNSDNSSKESLAHTEGLHVTSLFRTEAPTVVDVLPGQSSPDELVRRGRPSPGFSLDLPSHGVVGMAEAQSPLHYAGEPDEADLSLHSAEEELDQEDSPLHRAAGEEGTAPTSSRNEVTLDLLHNTNTNLTTNDSNEYATSNGHIDFASISVLQAGVTDSDNSGEEVKIAKVRETVL